MPANSRARKPSTQELEDAFISGFLKHSDLLDGSAASRLASDPPDFEVTHQGRRIAIELTEVLKADEHGSSLKNAESSRGWICREVADKLRSRGIRPLWISVAFSSDNTTGNRRDSLAEQIAAIAVRHDPAVGCAIEVRWQDEFSGGEWGKSWPVELHSIHLLRIEGMDEFEVSSSDIGWQQGECREILQAAIVRKEGDLIRYAPRYDETWLLLVAEGIAPSSFLDPNAESRAHEYAGSFTRAFFYLHFGGKIVELRLRRGCDG